MTKDIFDIVKDQREARWIQDKKKYLIDQYKDRGIILTAQNYKMNAGWYYNTLLRLNFVRASGDTTSIRAFTRNDNAEAVFNNVDVLLQKLKLPCIQSWKLRRIDYAFDVFTPHVGLYLKLLSKGKMPRGKHPYGLKGSVYLPNTSNTKTQTINIYDKKRQLENELAKQQREQTPEQDKQIKAALNMLRVETQVHNAGLHYFSKKYDAKRTISEFCKLEMAEQVVKRSVQTVEFQADYWRKSIALWRVFTAPSVTTARKERLMALIDEINKPHGSVEKVRRTSENLQKTDSDLRLLAEHNINPVCIPDREKIIAPEQAGKIERLPCVGSLIEYI